MSNQKYNQMVILITHDQNVALEADRILTIDDGKIVKDERVRQFMNILNELTVKNLKRNKKRTIVTRFGIILSVALVTAITTFVSSMQVSMIEYAKKSDGDYHIFLSEVPAEEQKYVLSNAKIEQTMIGQTIGEAPPEMFFQGKEEQENHKGMIKLKAFEEEALKNLGIQLIEGQMSENEREVLMPIHLNGLDGTIYETGDMMTLKVNGSEVTYTVAGLMGLNSFEFQKDGLYNCGKTGAWHSRTADRDCAVFKRSKRSVCICGKFKRRIWIFTGTDHYQ